MRTTSKKIILSGLAIAAISGIAWYLATRPAKSQEELVSRTGLHWHPELTIYVKGEKQLIPADIGLGAIHQPIHTHDDNDQGIIHMEFGGLAWKKDMTLGEFFKNWGKDMHSFGVNMKMTVNGLPNSEYENYLMHDKDRIELSFD